MVKYRTGSTQYGVAAKIEEIEIEKETDSSVWVRGRRLGKNTSWDTYHDTWEAAHAHLMAEAEKHVQSARLALERAKGAQGNVKGMKKP